MIVYGGAGCVDSSCPDYNGYALNTGGRYNPSTDSWRSTSTSGAPTKVVHSAVWTGTEMIVWGGFTCDPVAENNFNPNVCALNIPNGAAPESTETSAGARYNPVTDTWIPTSASGTDIGVVTPPPKHRHDHIAVWTGTEMIVWGGISFDVDGGTDPAGGLNNTGGRYDPVTDTWTAT